MRPLNGNVMLYFGKNSATNRKYLPSKHGPEVMQFIERLPPLARQRQRKVLEELERETAARWAKKQEQVTVTGQGPSAAEIAEEYIADCSNQLARLSAVAAMPDMWPADAVVR